MNSEASRHRITATNSASDTVNGLATARIAEETVVIAALTTLNEKSSIYLLKVY
uniref:Uncharacterized protein n=1 Tax=Heterorhabditis bacteriophora TaxID=37862 RepID=A0A1I7X4G7_HETBA